MKLRGRQVRMDVGELRVGTGRAWGYDQNTLCGHFKESAKIFFKKYREALVCSTALHSFTLM